MPTAEEVKLALAVSDAEEAYNITNLIANRYTGLTMSVSDTIDLQGETYVRAGVDYRYVVNIGGTIDKVDLREHGWLETDPNTGYYKENVMFYIPVPEGAVSMTYADGIFIEGSPVATLGTDDAPTIEVDGTTYFKMETSFIWNTSKNIDGDWRPMVGSEPNRASYTVTFVDELGGEIVKVQLTIDSENLTVNNVLPTNLTAYEAALAAVKEADYTEASWAAYQTVVDANVVTVANTQAEVDAATLAITTAQADLVFGGKAGLDTAKGTAAGLTENDYTVASWADLTAALELPETTNAEVVAKTTAINSAIENLQLILSYNGSVSGQITSSDLGVVNGTLDFEGTDDLIIEGNVTGTGNLTTFSGTVSGSINGTITAQINANGISTQEKARTNEFIVVSTH